MKPPPASAARQEPRKEEFREEPIPEVDILIESEAWRDLPGAGDIARQAVIAAAALETGLGNTEVSVLLCDDDTIAALNGRWRGQEKPTNVLSFPAPPAHGGVTIQENRPLGDIAIAYETLVREAGEGGKTASAHLAHLVVHGFLHLLGHDHETDDEAEAMERLEREILARIGVADPYAARDADF